MQRTCSVFIGKERIEILRLGSRHRGWDMPWAQSLVTVFLGFRRKKFKGYRGSIDIEQCGIRKYIAGNPVYGFAWACDGGYILPWGYFSRRKAETGQPLCSPYFKFPVCNLAFKRIGYLCFCTEWNSSVRAFLVCPVGTRLLVGVCL